MPNEWKHWFGIINVEVLVIINVNFVRISDVNDEENGTFVPEFSFWLVLDSHERCRLRLCSTDWKSSFNV